MKIILFLGAGASSVFGKPTTKDLKEKLRKKYEHNAPSQFLRYILNYKEHEDIEHVLQTLKDIQYFKNSFGGKFFNQPGLATYFHLYGSQIPYQKFVDEINPIQDLLENEVFQNYLLEPSIIERIVNRKLKEKNDGRNISDVKNRIMECSNGLRQKIEDSISDMLVYWEHQKKQSIEPSTANKASRDMTSQYWNNWDSFIALIPGKEILHCLREKIQSEYSVSFSNIEIASEMTKSEINEEIKTVLTEIASQ